MCIQLMCCAVESNGWHLYRESEWFRQFGARDDDPMTYEGYSCLLLHCAVTLVIKLVTKEHQRVRLLATVKNTELFC